MSAATPLLDDFLSGDRGRILRAASKVVRSRDAVELDPLLPMVPRIRQAMRKVDGGGGGDDDLERALRKLDDYRRGVCWCECYRAGDTFEPTKEQDAGHIRIVSTSEPGWSMTYEVECLVCGRGFTVDQRDGQIMTWKWKPHGEKRSRG